MNKFEKKFLGLLATKSGFYIKDYKSESQNISKYVAITETEQFAYCVIVSDEELSTISYKDAREELQKHFNKPVLVNVVIVVDKDYSQDILQDNFSKIIYSKSKKTVVYSNDGCKPLMPIFDYMKASEKAEKNRFDNKILTYILVAINIIVFIVTILQSQSIYNIDGRTLVNMGAKVNVLINDGQVWRLFTCAFLHGGLAHIFFNMYALLIIGPEVEYAYGKINYIIIYIVSALGGSIFSYIFSPNSISVGASGAIFGLLGAMLVFGIINRNKIGKKYMMNILQVIGINIVIGITISNIDNSAHIGGLVFGAVAAFVIGNRKTY